MGTKAVFAVASCKGNYFTTILGRTSDGIPENLEYTAYLFMDVARKLRVLTKVKRHDFDSIKKVMDAIELGTDGDIFVDQLKNAAWVSYSCIFDPATNILKHYEHLFEASNNTVEIPKLVASTQSEKCIEMWKQKNK